MKLPVLNPSRLRPRSTLIDYGLGSAADEWRALRLLVRSEWQLVVLLLVGIAIFFVFTKPLPPADVFIAVGQPGSEAENLGMKMQPIFAEQGVTLHLVNTAGSGASLADVAVQDVNIQAALVVGGVVRPGSQPTLYSLGSVEYIPLWLFYRGERFQDGRAFAHFADKRVAVGVEGSATETILKEMLAVTGIDVDNRPNFLKIPHKLAVEKLLAGEIDAVCLMDGFEGPNVQALLQRPDINIFSFGFADAYVKKLRFLDVVVVPKGALDLRAVRPPEDVRMLASTMTILVEKTMHPAIQQLFLVASDRISSKVDQFFAKPDYFPAYADHAVELSPVAKRYLEQGPPSLSDRIPLWILNYLDRMWLLLVGAIAVVYPVIKLFPSYRRIHSTMFISDGYHKIQACELAALHATTRGEMEALVAELDKLDTVAMSTFVASDLLSSVFSLRGTARSLRDQLIQRMATMS